jgi:hypothetical protein
VQLERLAAANRQAAPNRGREMTPIMRLSLSLIAFGTVGFALMQFTPAQSSDNIASRGYVLAISSGPGLSLAHSEFNRAEFNHADAAGPENRRVAAFARTAQRLSCGNVVQFAGLEIGTGCRLASD